MKTYTKTLMPIFLFMAGLVASGCAPLYDKNNGSEVTWNKKVQVVNPNAVNEQSSVAALEGQKAEALMSRYRKEKAEVPAEKLLKDISN
ncbi:MAG: hypothetical protein RQ936_07170 [Gammaproteobacteria bacterium]|nr:hypothetical protein [Gammaproteobacteria bacterium]